MNTKNCVGPRTEPCRTLEVTGTGFDVSPSNTTVCEPLHLKNWNGSNNRNGPGMTEYVLSDYPKLIHDAVNLGCYPDMVQIYALSAAVRAPIRSYYPPQVLPELSSDAYAKIECGRNITTKLKPTVSVMWPQYLVPRNVRYFVPNHFV